MSYKITICMETFYIKNQFVQLFMSANTTQSKLDFVFIGIPQQDGQHNPILTR